MKQELINIMTGKDFNYRKRCMIRLACSGLLILLGIWAVWNGWVMGVQGEFGKDVGGFYFGTGCGLIGAAGITIWKNIRYLCNSQLSHEKEIAERDERNRLLGLRCWSFTGYGTFLGLYVGMLLWGSRSEIVLTTLLCVMGGMGLLLLISRIVLSKIM